MSNDLEDAILEPRGCSTPGACSAVGPIRTLKAEVELIKKGWQVDIRRIDQLAAERDRLRRGLRHAIARGHSHPDWCDGCKDIDNALRESAEEKP